MTYKVGWVGEKGYIVTSETGYHLSPFEVGAIFSTVPERIVRYSLGRDTTKAAAQATLRMFSETFAFNPTPQLIHPIFEQVANRKFFTGSTIVPAGLERLDPEAQHRPWTSETAIEFGEAFGLSPLRSSRRRGVGNITCPNGQMNRSGKRNQVSEHWAILRHPGNQSF